MIHPSDVDPEKLTPEEVWDWVRIDVNIHTDYDLFMAGYNAGQEVK